LNEKESRATEILAVAIDSKQDLQKMVDRISKEDQKSSDLLFLSDPGHKVIDRFGILNAGNARGLPHPATYIIDRKGIVRRKFVETDYKTRPSNEQVLEALRAVR
jgi:peroxiredoxin